MTIFFQKCTSILLEGLKKTNAVAIFSNYILKIIYRRKSITIYVKLNY